MNSPRPPIIPLLRRAAIAITALGLIVSPHLASASVVRSEPSATSFVIAGLETVTEPARGGAAVSAGQKIRPERGRWSGPTDPEGFIGFKVTRPKRVYNVKNVEVYGYASCSTGRKVTFAVETRGKVGVDTGHKPPYFGFYPSGYLTSPDVEGPAYFRLDVLGRFISHVRATGELEIRIETTDPRFGICAAEDVSWRATFNDK